MKTGTAIVIIFAGIAAGCSANNERMADTTLGSRDQPMARQYTEAPRQQQQCTPSDEYAVELAYGARADVEGSADGQCYSIMPNTRTGRLMVDSVYSIKSPDECTYAGLERYGHKFRKKPDICVRVP